MKRTIEHVTRETDIDTGETIEVSKSIIVTTNSREDFIMMFLKTMGPIFQIKSAVDFKVIMKLYQISGFNTGEINLTTAKRIEVCEELRMQNTHLSNSLARLKKMGVITGAQGSFMLNPIFAWRGDLKARAKVIKKMQLDFKIQHQSTKFD